MLPKSVCAFEGVTADLAAKRCGMDMRVSDMLMQGLIIFEIPAAGLTSRSSRPMRILSTLLQTVLVPQGALPCTRM